AKFLGLDLVTNLVKKKHKKILSNESFYNTLLGSNIDKKYEIQKAI
ncbi:12971_t:CDS:1, partial [Gigaspora rosea]